MNIIQFIYKLNAKKIYLWNKNDGNLGYALDKYTTSLAPYKEEIVQYKKDLLLVLAHNEIFSREKAENTSFLKVPVALLDKKLFSIQSGMFVQSCLDTPQYTYTIPLFIKIPNTNFQALLKAFNTLLELHPIFRMQVSEDFSFRIADLSAYTVGQLSCTLSELNILCQSKAKQNFTHYDAPLIAPEIIQIEDTNDFVISLTHHHMLSDAYSVSRIKKLFLETYENIICEKQSNTSSREALNYFDYVEYQKYYLSQQDQKNTIAHFKEKLDLCEPLALKQNMSIAQSHDSTLVSFIINEEITNYLRDLSHQHNVSLYATLVTAFYYTLSTFAGEQTNFPMGITVANRPEEFKDAIGPFINTLPLISHYNPSLSLLENIQIINKEIVNLNENHYLNINLMVGDTQKSAQEILKLMNIMFTMHNFDEAESTTLAYEDILVPDSTEKFGITLTANEYRGQLNFTLNYINDLYDPAIIQSIKDSFSHMLSSLSDKILPQQINTLSLLNQRDYTKIINEWNLTDRPFCDNQTIHGMFEEQASKTPDAVAVIYNQCQLTYSELNEKANRLANHFVKQCDIKKEMLICVSLERSEMMLVALLGILKAGAAYVPIDPEYPDERIAYILKDTATSVIITQTSVQERLELLSKNTLVTDIMVIDSEAFSDDMHRALSTSPACPVSSSNLAYVIYTSGTTGEPKGTLLEHRGIINRIQWMNQAFPIQCDDKILQKTPFVFDVSVWELFWANWYGATIVFAKPGGHKDPEYLIQLINAQTITKLHFVPSMLGVFQEALNILKNQQPQSPLLPSLRHLFCSGEALSLSCVQRIKALLPHVAVHNLYGPTEASVDVTHLDCNESDLSQVTIGKPINNTSLYVCNSTTTPLPIGAIGELYIGGVNLARGYLNKPQITKDIFIDNPFQHARQSLHPHERLYKTGDLVRYNVTGDIEYIGRKDFQVKIRGNRVELGEIEAQLIQYDGIQQSVVVLSNSLKDANSAHNVLLGYYVSALPLDEKQIFLYLNNHLPEYMIPSILIHLTALPMTVNGKLDRKKLPSPTMQSSKSIIEPQDLIETNLRKCWAEVLNKPEKTISVHDDFFHLGGDSIMSIQLISKIRREYVTNITVKTLFNLRTLEQIASFLREETVRADESQYIQTEQGVLEGALKLLPIQLWFFSKQFAKPNHWNQAFVAKVPLLNITQLHKAGKALCAYHDALRLRFDLNDGRVQPYYGQDENLVKFNTIETACLTEDSEEWFEHLTQCQSHFDLAAGPVISITYIKSTDPSQQEARLLIAAHHLVIDTISWPIILSDLQQLYIGQKLLDKGTSYRQWSDAVRAYAEQHPEEQSYWDRVLFDYKPPQALIDNIQDATHTTFSLSVSDTLLLHEACHVPLKTNVNDVLLTALALALKDTLKGDVQHLMIEGHGREEIASDLNINQTVGWFTTLYPVRFEVQNDLETTLIDIKETLRATPSKGIGFGAIKGYNHSLPIVTFNYLGKIDRNTNADKWSLVHEPVGNTFHPDNQLLNNIVVFCHTQNDVFHCSIASNLGCAISDSISDRMKAHLNQLISFLNEATPKYTPSDFSSVLSESDLKQLPMIASRNQDDWFEMTEIQKSYLLGRIGSYEIGNVSNHIYSEYYYPNLSIERLEKAVNILIKHYSELRVVYSLEQLKQRYLSENDISYYHVSVNDCSSQTMNNQSISPIRERLSHLPYDAETFPLFTFEVTKFSDCYVVHFSMDLILLDVQSRFAFLDNLTKIYNDLNYQPAKTPISFKDYQDYCQYLQSSAWYLKDKSYWDKKIPSLPVRPKLPLKVDPTTVEFPKFSEHTQHIDKKTWTQFKSVISNHNVSEAAALLTLFGNILAYYSGDPEFLITLTLFNRYNVHPDVNAILGDFTSTTLFHYSDKMPSIVEGFKRSHDQIWEDISHAMYSGVSVQRDLAKFRDLEKHKAVSPIVFTGFINNKAQDYDDMPFLDPSESKEKRYWCAQTSQAWLDVQAVETKDGFMSKWLYVEQLFDPEFIDALNETFCQFIKTIANAETTKPVSFDPLLLSHSTVIEQANTATQPYSEDTLFGRYGKVVSSVREKLAVVDSGTQKQHTHQALWDDSEGMAHYLIDFVKTHALPKHQLIAVLSEKGYNQVVSTLAIMKAGYAYLPLNVDWPAGRQADIIREGQCHILLVSRNEQSVEAIKELLPHVQVLVIEDIIEGLRSTHVPATNPLPVVHADDIAYVIFTSGSTGKPKGVTISHRGALNTLDAVNQRFEVKADDSVFALSELSFDLSVYDIFGLLAVGGTIVFPAQSEAKNPKHWLDVIKKHQVTLWNTVPQLGSLLMDEMDESTVTTVLRLFLLSGDWCPLNLPPRIKQHCHDATVMVLGGATEGSIWSIWHEADEINPEWVSIPYGVAMPNQKMYVLNHQDNHCPMGVTGEIVIGGQGVALNYWGDEALTNQKYFYHPELGRLYRTGDLGKWHEAGYIEFLGRKDFQVKIRGYRVELGEIEVVLTAFDSVKQSVVLVKDRKESSGTVTKYLVGYYVAEEPCDHKRLSAYMTQHIPEYMVPSTFVHLDEMPLSANGKLDIKKLPEPKTEKTEIISPCSELEVAISKLWSQLLHKELESISIRDDFFNLGGDSIISIQLISKMRRELNIRISVKDLLKQRTIENLCKHITQHKQPDSETQTQIETGLLTGDIPLLPIQQWFFLQNFKNPNHWNQSCIVSIPTLNTDRLQAVIKDLCRFHDSLRIRFKLEAGKITQYYADDQKLFTFHDLDIGTIEHHNLIEDQLSQKMTEWQSQFDIQNGPLLSVGYIHGLKNGVKHTRLFMAAHHLIIDTVSFSTLIADLQTLYEGRSLSHKGSSYRQWSEFVSRYADLYPDEKIYWDALLADYQHPAYIESFSSNIGRHQLVLDAEQTTILMNDIHNIYHTNINDVLLTALSLSLTELFKSKVHHILMEGHGREDICQNIDINHTIGWFTTLFPMRLETKADLSRTLTTIKDSVRKIPNKGLGFGTLCGYDQPLPTISFNYLGVLDQKPDDQHWFFTDEHSGIAFDPQNQLLNEISIVAYCINNRLKFEVSTSLGHLIAEKINASIEKALKQIKNTLLNINRQYLTPSDVDFIIEQQPLDLIQKNSEVNHVFLANSLHQGFIYQALLYGEQDQAYRIQMKWHYEQSIDIEKLKTAWNIAQKTFPSLRLRFHWDATLLQIVDSKSQIDWQYVDLSELDSEELIERSLHKIQTMDLNRQYTLDTSPLFRVHVIKISGTRYTCLVNMHHAIIDGWSGQVLIGFVHKTYLKLCHNQPIKHFEDTAYIASQQYLQENKNKDLSIWQKYLDANEDQFNPIGLYLEHCQREKLQTYQSIEKQQISLFKIPTNLSKQLSVICQQHGLTLNTFYQYFWHKTLSLYGGINQTIVGTIFSGRNLPIDHIEKSVGLYINTLPVYTNHENDKGANSILSGLTAFQDQFTYLLSHGLVELSQLQKKGKRLFNTLFIFENYPRLMEENNVLKVTYDSGFEKHDYPLVLSVIEKASHWELKLEYEAQLFDCSKMPRLVNTYLHLLEQAAFNVKQPLQQLNLISAQMKEKLLQPWEPCQKAEPLAQHVADVFEQQVVRTPNQRALICGQQAYTYAALNAQVNQLAHYLTSHTQTTTNQVGVEPSIVGICLERSELLIMSLLATLKSGMVYVPISPDFPDQRIQQICNDLNFSIILTCEKSEKRLLKVLSASEGYDPQSTVLNIEDPEIQAEVINCSKANLQLTRTPFDLAYIIYTSGTTGTPNGVMIEHAAFASLLFSIKSNYFKDLASVSTYSVTNFVFDIFGLEYALPLLTGGTLTLGDFSFEQLDCTSYDFIQMTPQLLNLKLGQFVNTQNTTLLVGGEALKHSVLENALNAFPTVVNVYGPTETTIWSTAKCYKAQEPLPSFVSIGSALPNEQAIVLDNHMRPVPVGTTGELYLGGSGMARGYWNRPELTASKFVHNPFIEWKKTTDNNDKRLYKTGDLVRLLPNNEFEYLTRIDSQVKIRGYRIELEEIESTLLKHELIKQAAVIVKEMQNEQYLIAYIATQPLASTITEEDFIKQLKSDLKQSLLEYMIPQYVFTLDALPLSPSGKTNKIALHNLNFMPTQEASEKSLLKGEYETQLQAIWCEVLGRNTISRNDNFFDLGGNSLLLIKMYQCLSTEIKKTIKMLDIFQHPTIAALNELIASKCSSNTPQNNDTLKEIKDSPTQSIQKNHDIAVIGMAGRFPKAENLDEFWKNLINSNECTTFYSRDELLKNGISAEELDKPTYVLAQSKLNNIKHFDADFFGYSKREAEIMDPQHRIFMECAWTALEDANYNPFKYDGKIGLYAGCGQNDYLLNHVMKSHSELDMAQQYQLMIHNQSHFLCTKVAYKLNLTGPAITLQTACSTSLVAVHQACNALLSGDCDIALAGAISIGQVRPSGYHYQEGMIFSPDGKCRPFDKAAQGTFEGQGVGLLVLKPLEKAEADNDNIYAVIKGTAINNDGHDKIGYTAPSVNQQAEVIKDALHKAGITSDTIGYLEAHGTGTNLGDPIEIKALNTAFDSSSKKQPSCTLGSVKSNIGHLDVAAGMAGMIKTISSLYHQKLVPTLHFKEANPLLNLSETPFSINTDLKDWEAAKNHPRRAGVSSFGIGGTNAHVILEEYTKTNISETNDQSSKHLISVSANSKSSLKSQINNIMAYCHKSSLQSISSIGYTLHTRRHQFKHNAFFILDQAGSEKLFHVEKRHQRPVVFMFPGQGAHYLNMGSGLYEAFPSFKHTVDECLRTLSQEFDQQFCYQTLFNTENLNKTALTQPALFILEYAIAKLLISFGVNPDLMMGHSLGEYVAACVSGVFTIQDALRLVAARGKLIQKLPKGKMLAISRTPTEIANVLEAHAVSIAAVNDTHSCVVSGGANDIQVLSDKLTKLKIHTKLINVSHAFHSLMLDPILSEFRQLVSKVTFGKITTPFVSNLTGKMADYTVQTPEYWVKHLRQTVLFSDGVHQLIEHSRFEDAVFIEAGPGNTLVNLLRKSDLYNKSQIMVSSCIQNRTNVEDDEHTSFLRTLGYLWGAGIEILWDKYYQHKAVSHVKLPPYPFDRTTYWIDMPMLTQPKPTIGTEQNLDSTLPLNQYVDPIARIVRQTWKNILGACPENDSECFYDCGGDSLSALQFVSQLKLKTGVHLDLMSIPAPNLNEIIHAVQLEDKHATQKSPLVTIRDYKSSSKPPIIMIHPIGGDIYFYRDLISCLPENQSIYAIRSPMLDDVETPDSIEALADAYLKMLYDADLVYSCILLGSSFGGIVAYEMAQQLSKTCDFSPKLVMIDSPAYSALPKRMSNEEILIYLMKYGLSNIDININQLHTAGDLDKQLDLICEKAKACDQAHLFTKPFLKRYLNIWHEHTNMMHRYQPEPYSGDVQFFAHSEVIEAFPTNQATHWKPFIQGKYQIIKVPGHHISMNAYPNVQIMADHLIEFLFKNEVDLEVC